MDRPIPTPFVFAPIVTALLAVLVAVACAGTRPAGSVAPSAPSRAVLRLRTDAGAPACLDPSIEEAIAFREQMGLRADLGWVQAVAANPDATEDWGVPLLPFEIGRARTPPDRRGRARRGRPGSTSPSTPTCPGACTSTRPPAAS